jgi:histidine triad (HIT) family protein
MKNCIFCKINKKEEKALILWENEHLTCFLPNKMEVLWHTLIIPKKHANNIFDIEEKQLIELTKWIQLTCNILKKILKADWINILNANWSYAWQSIPHLHFHIMPRFKDDNLNLWPLITPNNHNRENIYSLLIEWIKSENIH